MTSPLQLVMEAVKACDERALKMKFASLIKVPDGSEWTIKVHVDVDAETFRASCGDVTERSHEGTRWLEHQVSEAITILCFCL